jgi:hypothetical protein
MPTDVVRAGRRVRSSPDAASAPGVAARDAARALRGLVRPGSHPAHSEEADMANRDNLDVGMNRDATGARDWSSEESYWRSNYATRPYVSSDRGFDYYGPGYRFAAAGIATSSAASRRGRTSRMR